LSESRRDEIALLLIEKGADVMAQNYEGENVLWSSALHSEPKVVLALLRAGADVNHGNPLAQAASYGKLENARCLVEAGADINATESPVGPALHAAS
jgi:ankyrin repeat protein